ncbi:hypothetical protein FOL47_009008 [Perkinsus chesapeaki]|uniref:Coatomer subunit alpha n=1 Tax=Perkinsus chesapeaki TaxID=330153 RepID=A0A7J6LAZ3_PERCH|nr:hypothetical protein FOL47_009008 [Perkinsus chesapeaki]
MLVKCETKSNRVKGLSFHPKQTWILASLHNGLGTLIDTFDEHEGPVRGVCFHRTQPLFVSGGDDYKIKVWNYRLRRCIFTLLGHLDYIRTVQFHNEYPWIVSASDDQTVRIWNWQSRSCIAVLTGHNHYVMCAQFHPTQDLVVSASLDQTIRVWDTTGLRDKTVSIGSMGGGMMGPMGGAGGSRGGGSLGAGADMFGTTDAVVKYVLEGHERGVNWASFHPTMPLIVSGSDDRLIKIWRMGDGKAWEVDTLRGHFNNVSAVAFTTKKDLIISDSEDRTIRVWDATKRVAIHTFRRENDRFWILAVHPTNSLIAAGHDSGMVVFKLDRERPVFALGSASGHSGQSLYLAKDGYLTVQNIDQAKVQPGTTEITPQTTSLATLRRPPNAMVSSLRQLMVNPYSSTDMNAIVMYMDQQNVCSYDLYTCTNAQLTQGLRDPLAPKEGASCNGACFVSRNRLAVLHRDNTLGLYNLNNELVKKFEPPVPKNQSNVEAIYQGGNNKVLLRSGEVVQLFDFNARSVVGEITVAGGVRYVVWSKNMDYVAFLGKHNITLANGRNLELLHSLHENVRVKSGVWDETQPGVFVFTTLSHLKYTIINGDYGIINSLAEVYYLCRVTKQTVVYLDRENAIHKRPLNNAEYCFKVALWQKRYDDVKKWIKQARVCGNVSIGYLKSKGYPEVALQFVDDPLTRFNLSLEFGHLDEALSCAKRIDQKEVWGRLGKEALRQGNVQMVEMVYQKTRNLSGLSFLYLSTGNRDKLKKMLTIAKKRNDPMERFNTAMYLGDVEERARVLAEAGQLPLAAIMAKTYGLDDLYQELSAGNQALTESAPDVKSSLLQPPVPLTQAATTNWPFLMSMEQIFDNKWAGVEEAAPAEEEQQQTFLPGFDDEEENVANAGGFDAWGDDALAAPDEEVDVGNAWGSDEDLGLGDIDLPASPQDEAIDESIVTPGEGFCRRWLRNRKLVPDLIAAGEFDEALGMLQRSLVILQSRIKSSLLLELPFGSLNCFANERMGAVKNMQYIKASKIGVIGLINAAPLKPLFEEIYSATRCSLPSLPLEPSVGLPVVTATSKLGVPNAEIEPAGLFTVQFLLGKLREGHKLTTMGKFKDSLEVFRYVLQACTMATAANSEEEAQLTEFIEVCSQYVQGMRLETTRRELPHDQVSRSLELSAYFTCVNLQPSHHLLTLRAAMTQCFKAHNYLTAANMARRLMLGNFGASKTPEVVNQARKILAVCEQRGTDAHEIDFDSNDTDPKLTICSRSMSVIYPNRGEAVVRCPYCNADYKAEFAGSLCDVCQLSEIGARVLGVQFRPL